MMKLILIAGLGVMFTGCTGAITGHEYTAEERAAIYGVVKDGVKNNMKQEKIEKYKLDKADKAITTTHRIVTDLKEGKGAE